MERTVSPARQEMHRLRQPLTDGERKVFEFFDRTLPQEWEIYLQPHLNGLRPDLVLLNPAVGIAVFEVKDWDLDAMRYWMEPRPGRPPALMAERGGKRFSRQTENPIEKLHLYKEEIRNLYCPRLSERAGLAVVTAGLVFTRSLTSAVRHLLEPAINYWRMTNGQYYPVVGVDALEAGDLHEVFPEGLRRRSYIMDPQLAADLRNWLVEADAEQTQRSPLELDKKQEWLVRNPTKTGYRKIKGPAGSGKSMVLAARAADLAAEGRSVLVVTFNITLRNYLQDLAVRRNPAARKDVTWLNFHDWCKRVCHQGDFGVEYRKLWREYFDRSERLVLDQLGFDDAFNHDLCTLVAAVLDDGDEGIETYDAILVDEGQDFRLEWWKLLRKACKPGGEMLLVADQTQDVYGTAPTWTDDSMPGTGLPGQWVRLGPSYRLPSAVIREARRFAETYLDPRSVSE